MLKTSLFEFNKKGEITIFIDPLEQRFTFAMFKRIVNDCFEYSRLKHIKRPYKFRMVPTLN